MPGHYAKAVTEAGSTITATAICPQNYGKAGSAVLRLRW